LKKNKVAKITLGDKKTLFIATVIKTVMVSAEKQTHRSMKYYRAPDIVPHKYVKLIHDTGKKNKSKSSPVKEELCFQLLVQEQLVTLKLNKRI
jgi:hypothetical protein